MKRKLGQLEVGAIGMGCWAIGGEWLFDTQEAGWGAVNDTESIKAIETALDMGVTLFDTAANYGAGHSEIILGQALGKRRASAVIATKFGYGVYPEQKRVYGLQLTPNEIRLACEASLKRLGTDYIDLYQLHVGDHPQDALEDILATLEQLIDLGWIRGYGWSTDDPARASAFARGQHCVAIQHQQNIFEDNAAMLQFLESANLASINRGPLGMGLLTGKFSAGAAFSKSDVRFVSPQWMAYFQHGQPNPEWLAKLESIREILCANGRSLAQGALAWLLARSNNTIPVPGFRTALQVKENAAVLTQGALQITQMQAIQTILSTN